MYRLRVPVPVTSFLFNLLSTFLSCYLGEERAEETEQRGAGESSRHLSPEGDIYGTGTQTKRPKGQYVPRDKTSQYKTFQDIRSQGQTVPGTKRPKDKTSQGTVVYLNIYSQFLSSLRRSDN